MKIFLSIVLFVQSVAFFSSCGTTDGLAPGGCTYDKEWTMQDEWTFAAAYNTDLRSLAIKNNYLFSIGEAGLSSTAAWCYVRRSDDDGKTWKTVDLYRPASSDKVCRPFMVRTWSSTVISCGLTYDSLNVGKWMMRRSTDNGETWQTVDDSWRLATGKHASCKSIKKIGNKIFAAGSAQDSSSVYHLIIKRSDDDGASWQTVDDQQSISGEGLGAAGRYIATIGTDIYVSATSTVNSVSGMVTRVSSDGGTTWSTVDTPWYYQAGKTVASWDFMAQGGSLFRSIYSQNSANIYKWLIQKSADYGRSWNTIDDYQDGENHSFAGGMAVDYNSIWVVGRSSHPTTSKNTWLVRKSEDLGGSWKIVDEVRSSSLSNIASSIQIRDSNVFVGGKFYSSSNKSRAAVRALWCR